MKTIKYRVENGSGLYGLETQQTDGTWIAMVCPRFNVKSNKILTCGQWCPMFDLLPDGGGFYNLHGMPPNREWVAKSPSVFLDCCGRVIELEVDQ